LHDCVQDLIGGITDKTGMNEAAGRILWQLLLYGDCKYSVVFLKLEGTETLRPFLNRQNTLFHFFEIKRALWQKIASRIHKNPIFIYFLDTLVLSLLAVPKAV